MGDNGGSVATLPQEAILTARKCWKLKKIFDKVHHFRYKTRHFRGLGSSLFSSERSMTTINDVMKCHHKNDVSKAKFRNCERVTSRVGFE